MKWQRKQEVEEMDEVVVAAPMDPTTDGGEAEVAVARRSGRLWCALPRAHGALAAAATAARMAPTAPKEGGEAARDAAGAAGATTTQMARSWPQRWWRRWRRGEWWRRQRHQP